MKTKFKTATLVLIIISMLMSVSILSGQFKSDRQKELESILMAPCCGGGTMAEHDDNQHTLNMKMIINSLTTEEFDKSQILALFETTYSNEGIYRLGFAPATKPTKQIIDHVNDTIHPNMTLADIVDLFAWIHKPTIRSAPPEEGIHHLAWKMPAILLVLGVVIIFFVIRMYMAKPAPVISPAKGDRSESELEKQIEKEMKELQI